MSRIAWATAAVLVATSCSASGAGSLRPSVVAAFYPLQYAAERVGGDDVTVESLTPSGVEPHDLELSSSQVRDLAEADLVVYVGQGFQPAVEDALGSLDESRQVDALDGLQLRHGSDAAGGEETVDPHVWLDPTLMERIVDRVAEVLSKIDPEKAASFDANARALDEQLEQLDYEYQQGLANCSSQAIVTSHAAFGYLAARYGLEQVSVGGIDPEAEPSPQRLSEVVRYVNEHDVKIVFFEELAPRDVADTLARETGATTEILSPLETEPDHGDYLDAMRANLAKLERALDCE